MVCFNKIKLLFLIVKFQVPIVEFFSSVLYVKSNNSLISIIRCPKPMQRPMTVGQMQQQHHTIQQQQHQSGNPLQQTQMKGILLL